VDTTPCGQDLEKLIELANRIEHLGIRIARGSEWGPLSVEIEDEQFSVRAMREEMREYNHHLQKW